MLERNRFLDANKTINVHGNVIYSENSSIITQKNIPFGAASLAIKHDNRQRVNLNSLDSILPFGQVPIGGAGILSQKATPLGCSDDCRFGRFEIEQRTWVI